MKNEPTIEQSLESVDDGDLGQEIERLSRKLEQIQSGRDISELTKDEAGEILALMKKVEELQKKLRFEKQETEAYWSYEMFVDWARDEVGEDDPEAWLEKTFDLSDISRPLLIGRVLRLTDIKTVTRLPLKLKGKYMIKCSGTSIYEIPSDIDVDILELVDTPIKEIPAGVKAKKLFINQSPVEFISPDIEVERLNAIHTAMDYIPEVNNVSILNMRRTNVNAIPPQTKFKELILAYTDVEEIPDDIEVEKLSLRNTKVQRVEGDINCTMLSLSYSQVKEIPDKFEHVRTLLLDGCDVRVIPRGVSLEELNLDNSGVEEIEPDVEIDKLYLRNTPVKKIPVGFHCEILDLTGCMIEAVSQDIEITGRLLISYDLITPSALSVLVKLVEQGKIADMDEGDVDDSDPDWEEDY